MGDLDPGGRTDMGAALHELTAQLRVPPMEPWALPPALVLVPDGRPTDDVSVAPTKLLPEPWGAKAVRLAVAIGRDADLDVLDRFIAHAQIRPFAASDARELLHMLRWASMRWASTAASRLASAPIAEDWSVGDLIPPPLPSSPAQN